MVKSIVDRVVKKAEFTVLGSNYHQFKPFGVSCVYLLAESHISIHTWPESNYVAVDIFTCGDESKAFEAAKLLEKGFSPKKVKKQILVRDYYKKSRMNIQKLI